MCVRIEDSVYIYRYSYCTHSYALNKNSHCMKSIFNCKCIYIYILIHTYTLDACMSVYIHICVCIYACIQVNMQMYNAYA